MRARASRPRPDWPAAWPAPTSIYIAQNVANADLVLVKPVNWVNPQASVYCSWAASASRSTAARCWTAKADTRTATEKAYPTVTARILADLNAQIARYEVLLVGRAGIAGGQHHAGRRRDFS